MYFLLFRYHLPLGMSVAFLLSCAMFGRNWSSGSGEDDFRPSIFAISLLFPLEDERGPSFKQT